MSTISLNHRQCEKTKLTPSTRNGYFLTEGFRGTNDAVIASMTTEFTELFHEFFGGECRHFTIDRDQPEVSL